MSTLEVPIKWTRPVRSPTDPQVGPKTLSTTPVTLEDHGRPYPDLGKPAGLVAQVLSVRKVVPTLTSRCTEIGLSMADAKQQWDTRFILVPAVGHTPSRGAPVALYCKAPWCS
jgi:hypothetical protein